MRGAEATLGRLIRRAIARRRVLEFVYDGQTRIAEPHDYGAYNGVHKLLCYQIGGRSRSGKVPDWRTYLIRKIVSAKATEAAFKGQRAVPGKHLEWDELFASVSRKPFKRRR